MFTEDCVFHPTFENYVMIFSFCTIFCLSVVGNSIVVVVILQQKSMRSITNLYLLNLALSDLLLSVVCMPPTLVSSLVYCWVFGDFLCKVMAYLQPVVVTASAYTLAAIALERYYAICKPLHSRIWHTRFHAFCVIGIVWLIAIISNVFMLFMYELRTYNRSGLNCAPKYEPIVHFGYQIYMTVVLLVIPLALMTVLYGSVIQSLRSGLKMDIAAIEVAENSIDRLDSARTIAGNKSRSSSLVTAKNRRAKTPLIPFRSEESNGMESRKGSGFVEQSLRSTHSSRTAIAKQRLIRMLIVIVIIFFCCWTPSYIWWLLLNAQDSFGTFNVWNSKLNTFITVLTYLSSCTNPITYCFLNSKFRTALFLTFGCKKNALRTRFQKVYAPGGNSGTPQYYRGNVPSVNVSFKEADSNSNESHSKQTKRSESLTSSVLNRLRSVINRKEFTEIPRKLDAKAFTDEKKTFIKKPENVIANGKVQMNSNEKNNKVVDENINNDSARSSLTSNRESNI
uniref:G-protein coupled receptors family 1 profile domain-containing protein n=1 Tax=Panagrolaimus sp. JU765 TaxID=591449 RepID=A0AC34RR54_9BILA